MAEGDTMTATSQILVALEPLNEDAQRTVVKTVARLLGFENPRLRTEQASDLARELGFAGLSALRKKRHERR